MLKGRFQSLRGLRIRINKKQDHARAVLWFRVCCVLHNLLTSDRYDENWSLPEDIIAPSAEAEPQSLAMDHPDDGKKRREEVKRILLLANPWLIDRKKISLYSIEVNCSFDLLFYLFDQSKLSIRINSLVHKPLVDYSKFDKNRVTLRNYSEIKLLNGGRSAIGESHGSKMFDQVCMTFFGALFFPEELTPSLWYPALASCIHGPVSLDVQQAPVGQKTIASLDLVLTSASAIIVSENVDFSVLLLTLTVDTFSAEKQTFFPVGRVLGGAFWALVAGVPATAEHDAWSPTKISFDDSTLGGELSKLVGSNNTMSESGKFKRFLSVSAGEAGNPVSGEWLLGKRNFMAFTASSVPPWNGETNPARSHSKGCRRFHWAQYRRTKSERHSRNQNKFFTHEIQWGKKCNQ